MVWKIMKNKIKFQFDINFIWVEADFCIVQWQRKQWLNSLSAKKLWQRIWFLTIAKKDEDNTAKSKMTKTKIEIKEKAQFITTLNENASGILNIKFYNEWLRRHFFTIYLQFDRFSFKKITLNHYYWFRNRTTTTNNINGTYYLGNW